MIRILRLRKLRLVAWIAIRVHELVIAIRVAVLTLYYYMSSGEREARRRMVKRCGMPRRLHVTRQAIVTELSLLMIRICCAIEIRGMTIPAGVRQILVLIIHVTLIARNRLMCTDKRVAGVRVIERRWEPRCACVAWSAIMIEVAQYVIRTLRLGKLRLVAWIAIRVRQLIVAVDVALYALRRCVASGQWKIRRVVIEGSAIPTVR